MLVIGDRHLTCRTAGGHCQDFNLRGPDRPIAHRRANPGVLLI